VLKVELVTKETGRVGIAEAMGERV